MSAAEKLKALEDRADALILSATPDNQEFIAAMWALLCDIGETLPQIVAVVEEAECYADEFLSLAEALAALDEALS